MSEESRASRLRSLSPLPPRKPGEVPEPPADLEAYAEAPPAHPDTHAWTNLLATASLLAGGEPEVPAPAAQVQTQATAARTVEEAPSLVEIVRARTLLDQAIEKAGEAFATVADRQEAIEALLDRYAELERQRGTRGEEITAELERVRGLLKLA
jgi:hypothetical protein